MYIRILVNKDFNPVVRLQIGLKEFLQPNTDIITSF